LRRGQGIWQGLSANNSGGRTCAALSHPDPEADGFSYNIAPSQKVLTIRFNPEMQQRSLKPLQWGLIPYWAKDPKIAYRTINARN
jgi:putative SOS response-associated peptidase YedK